MSDYPSSSTAAASPRETEADTNIDQPHNNSSNPLSPDGYNGYNTPKARRLAQNQKREEFVRDILMKLDFLIYAELCILYYLDCSFVRLLMRTLAQVVFLTPKPPYLPPVPAQRPYIGAFVGTNTICILFHLFTSLPQAGEITRGYLHGGLILDFIGQKASDSRLRLVLMDLLIMGLQCFMLAVEIERLRLKDILSQANNSNSDDQTRTTQTNQQDHDAEERGVMGDSIDESGDIEMQSMRHPRGVEDDEDDEHNQLLAEPRETEDVVDNNRHALDVFFSGQAIVGDFHVLHTLRMQWNEYNNMIDRRAAALASSSSNPAPGRAATTVQRNARLPAPLRRFMERRR